MATVEPDDELVGGLLGGRRADATVLRMLGNQLRRLREAAGVTPDQAGYEIRASVMDEAALRRPVGGREAVRSQLQRLVEVAALPQVTIQVVPFRYGGHAARAARSPSCASRSRACPMWSTSSSSPAPSTWKATRT